MSTRTVHLVVPDGIDDPERPSGGNVYDRRLYDGLRAAGRPVRLHEVPGDWPEADAAARGALAAVLRDVPGGSPVLVDGLVGCAAPEVLVPASHRVRLGVLLHAPVGDRSGDAGERAVLRSAALVVTTSRWARDWVLETYGLDPEAVHVASPGVDPADVADGGDGSELLCVASVTPGKGHDLLLDALARLTDLDWRCVCVGALTRAPGFVAELRDRVDRAGLGERLVVAGPRTGADLAASYAAADALVLASRAESYGMVVTEALARGLPVLGTEVGGVREALGRTEDGTAPGVLVPAGDAEALAGALRGWLSDPGLRDGLRSAALARRTTLTDWSQTVGAVSAALEATR